MQTSVAPVVPDERAPQPSPVSGRSVLITGGSGAFGQAFAACCLIDGARKVVIVSRGEAKQAAMRAAMTDPRLRFEIGDVRDRDRMVSACRGIDIVIHAAALKRVEVCESEPREAKKTNIDGTENVADACIANGVTRAVFLSTDKAASPATLYGTTKLAAERLWIGANVLSAGTPLRFAVTRYGNVWGSTGSVVPTWRAEAAAGRPITITEPTMSRFFMRMSEAVDLVMLAIRDMRGGEIFIPKLHAATVADMAHVVAPGATWRMTGARPGEKLHELLISEDEAGRTYDAGTHYIVEPPARSWESLPALDLPRVPDRFSYRSDIVPAFTADALREMAA